MLLNIYLQNKGNKMEQQIKSLLYELGLPVIQKDVQKSPSQILIHYNLADITQLADIQKKIRFLSAYLHTDILVKKSSVGHFALSLPNPNGNIVKFYDKDYEFLFTNKFNKNRTIFAGINEENTPVLISLDNTPHILVAGTTGSGKSVMINNIICSLIRNMGDDNIEFYMIDTKRVELSSYKKLASVCNVANTPEDAIEMLDKVCGEIDTRYLMMEDKGWRQIPDDFYRIVVVIEELGDLMMTSKKAVEKYIVKIAQLGRACGVHLIVATQRPTVDVLTGHIKANIGCRFALQTTSAIDSRNILGHNGAELLKGKGDCLMKLPDKADEIRIQCPYLDDKDIERCIKEYNKKWEE